MKILQVNCVYKVGSTGKIVDSIGQALREQGYGVFTCYGIGEVYYDDYSQKVCTNLEHKVNALLSRLIGIPFGGLFFSNKRIYKRIKSFQPDIVHVHCVNASTMNVYKLFHYLAKNKIKTVVTLHAEIFHTAGCEHAYDCVKYKDYCHHCEVYKRKVGSCFFERSKKSWSLMKNAFDAFNQDDIIITAVSPWLAERAKQSAILRRFRIEYVPNGVDTNIFYYRKNSGLIDREQYKKVVLFVTAYYGHESDDLKGGRYLPTIASMLPEYKFVIVASRISDNLGELAPNIQIWGKAKDLDELAQLYSEADVSLLLSRRETFSMVTAESLCCGTPVVGFKAGGPESIALMEYCSFTEYGDTRLVANNLAKLVCGGKESIASYADSEYSKTIVASSFLKFYNHLKCI